MERFYRFQKTTELEKESHFEFLTHIFLTIGADFNNWNNLKKAEKKELKNQIVNKWDLAIQLWWKKNQEHFSNEVFSDEVDFLIDTLSKMNFKAVYDFMMLYTMDGIFAVKASDYPDKNELFSLSKSYDWGPHNNYMVEMEVEDSIFFGKEYGYLVKPTRIIAVESVPQQYIKK